MVHVEVVLTTYHRLSASNAGDWASMKVGGCSLRMPGRSRLPGCTRPRLRLVAGSEVTSY
jgi:hypothetical protein